MVADRVAEPHGLADHRRIAAERRRPEAVRQHGGAGRLRPIVGRVRAGGRRTGRSPITSKYDPPTTPARTTRGSPSPTIVKSMVEKSPKAVSVLTRDAEVANLGDGEVGVLGADPLGALADVDQAILVAVDQRPQQHAADDAEDRGVGADAERERHDDGEGQPLDPASDRRANRKSVTKLMQLSVVLTGSRSGSREIDRADPAGLARRVPRAFAGVVTASVRWGRASDLQIGARKQA